MRSLHSGYLSKDLERLQKRAMKIIYPEISYAKALDAVRTFNTGVFAWANLNDMAFSTSKTKPILITTQQKFNRLNDLSLDVFLLIAFFHWRNTLKIYVQL